jgi:hypothetical protein
MKRKAGSMVLNWEQRFAALAMVASEAGIPSSIIAEIQQRSLVNVDVSTGKADAIQVVAILRSATNPQAASECCKRMAHLAICGWQCALKYAGALNAVVAAMRTFPQDSALQQQGCIVLANMNQGEGKCAQHEAAMAGAFEVVVAAVNTVQPQEVLRDQEWILLSHACITLGHMTGCGKCGRHRLDDVSVLADKGVPHRDEVCKSRAASAGVIEALIRNMRAVKTDSDAQLGEIKALMNISSENDSGAENTSEGCWIKV